MFIRVVLRSKRDPEAADVLEIPVGTVMSRLHRGRRVLKKALADHTDPEPA